jgi:2-dehydropantoate 2-reductase
VKIAVLGGAGAMGSVIGGKLSKSGNDVTLIDTSIEAVKTIEEKGLLIEDKSGNKETIRIRATNDFAVDGLDLVLVFVKCYHTEAAVKSIAPYLSAKSVVLSLQNGWGNAPLISSIVGQERTMIGVSYHSATVLTPGHVLHAGQGMTFIGELNGQISDRLNRISEVFKTADLDITPSASIIKEVWSKLSLNVCTLPTSALLKFYAGQLIEHEPMIMLMREILREAIQVANAQSINLDEEERWKVITGLLERAAKAKASMLQDVERQRRTEIDVINGAIVEAGKRLNIPTPYNQSMVWLIKSLEGSFNSNL